MERTGIEPVTSGLQTRPIARPHPTPTDEMGMSEPQRTAVERCQASFLSPNELRAHGTHSFRVTLSFKEPRHFLRASPSFFDLPDRRCRGFLRAFGFPARFPSLLGGECTGRAEGAHCPRRENAVDARQRVHHEA